MSTRTRAAVVAPVLAVTAALALTGCGRLGAHGPSGSGGSSGGTSASSVPATSDPAMLDGISQDLGAAGTANSEADSNAQAGDKAAATGDEP